MIIEFFFHRDFLNNEHDMYVFRIANKQVMSGRFNFLILIVKDQVDTATLPAELRLYLSKISLITVRNEVAKVMFLQVSVCPQGGLPQCMLGYHPPPEQTPRNRQPPRSRQPPPRERRLLLRMVRILLECILVQN